jgi:phytoene/squalene synthetase
MYNTATLARSITKAGSTHTYLTIRLLVDKDLVDDCMRAYAYFRWADDMIDISSKSSAERIGFIARQKLLVDNLYKGIRLADICPEEEILAELVDHDRGPDSGLRAFILKFMSVIEFDATRKGRLASRQELSLYTSWLASAVMDGIQYFIGNGHPYPKTMDRNLAVTGAHIVHMLRDTLEDIPAGYINIPVEELEAGGICIEETNSEQFRAWVREQVDKAEVCFHAGKEYTDRLDVLRCKLAGAWYCARFEWFLNEIKRDGYRLRRTYPERQALANWLKMIGLGLKVVLGHFVRNFQRRVPRPDPQLGMGTERTLPIFRAK